MEALDATQSEMQELHGQHNPITPPESPESGDSGSMVVSTPPEFNRESFSDQLAHLTLAGIDPRSDPQLSEQIPEMRRMSEPREIRRLSETPTPFGLANLSVNLDFRPKISIFDFNF